MMVICFRSEYMAARIRETNDVAELKTLGRFVANYDENIWNGIRQIVV